MHDSKEKGFSKQCTLKSKTEKEADILIITKEKIDKILKELKNIDKHTKQAQKHTRTAEQATVNLQNHIRDLKETSKLGYIAELKEEIKRLRQ